MDKIIWTVIIYTYYNIYYTWNSPGKNTGVSSHSLLQVFFPTQELNLGLLLWFLGGLDVTEAACNAGELGLIPVLGRSPGEWNSYPLQSSGLENSMDGWLWQATVHGVTKSRTWLSNFHFCIAGRFFTFCTTRDVLYHIVCKLVAQMAKNLPAMQETQVRSLGQEDPLEKEMATHSSILAWRIPWREEAGGLQSMGSQRVRHGPATNTDRYFNRCFINISYFFFFFQPIPAFIAKLRSLSQLFTHSGLCFTNSSS